ncbi:GNAT family N-acetyltransferase [Paenibacillus campi]|uniref:GNAT family N-acetyltransferase n=1 Tax=Paenibacillus campi TaxID=3106031 RepID=UPI002AFF86D2|nr:GNAT family N-acetyltransferase [Paenibacillus sp. SGZ-1014]
MTLILHTWDSWNEQIWQQLKPIYEEAFIHGAKPERIIRQMLDRQIAHLHAGYDGDELIAMALTGFSGTSSQPTMIIDYMAIRQDRRGRGEGKIFFELLRDWGVTHHRIDAIIIEAEAEDTRDNRERIVFWEKCGFLLTSYVHHYIWIPETYRALVLPLQPDFRIDDDGEHLFEQITDFHERSFRKQKGSLQ